MRLPQHIAVKLIEATNCLSRELEVHDLILADRHEVRIVNRHVRRLQQRIPEKPQRREILVGELLLLILVGGHPLAPGNRNHPREEQKQLRMFRHE